MTDNMIPIIRQMLNAASHRERARVLLQLPDSILLKYFEVFAKACVAASFEAGAEFIVLRQAACRATRDENGILPAKIYQALESERAAMIRFACGTDDL